MSLPNNIQNAIDKINIIQAIVLKDKTKLTKNLNNEFIKNRDHINSFGYNLSKKKYFDDNGRLVRVLFKATKPKQKTLYGEFVKLDKNLAAKHNNECTTSTLKYLLDKFEKNPPSYQQIRKLQNEYARRKFENNSINGWNSIGVLFEIIKPYGYRFLNIKKSYPHAAKIPTGKIAEMFKDFKHPIAMMSSKHIAPAFEGKIYDLWDSRDKNIIFLFVHKDDKTKAIDFLKNI